MFLIYGIKSTSQRVQLPRCARNPRDRQRRFRRLNRLRKTAERMCLVRLDADGPAYVCTPMQAAAQPLATPTVGGFTDSAISYWNDIVPDGVDQVAIDLRDGTRHVTQVRNNYWMLSLPPRDFEDWAPKRIQWLDGTGSILRSAEY
jgi:hypothetical protein